MVSFSLPVNLWRLRRVTRGEVRVKAPEVPLSRLSQACYASKGHLTSSLSAGRCFTAVSLVSPVSPVSPVSLPSLPVLLVSKVSLNNLRLCVCVSVCLGLGLCVCVCVGVGVCVGVCVYSSFLSSLFLTVYWINAAHPALARTSPLSLARTSPLSLLPPSPLSLRIPFSSSLPPSLSLPLSLSLHLARSLARTLPLGGGKMRGHECTYVRTYV
jgi:hypothetical protein